MPVGQRPLVRRRLRTELRQERERAGKSQAEVAKKMDWSLSKIIRLEAGQVGVSTNDLKALLDLYGVNETERRTFFIELARSARQQSSWWSAFRDIVPSSEYADFLGYETDATSLNYYCSLILPGLLQTEDYAREIFERTASAELDETTVDRLVELRMARKRQVLDRDDPPELNVVLDESALHRVVGGPEVMSDQISSIAEVAQLDNVTIRVIPFATGGHPGMNGPFEILEFNDPADPPVVQFDAAPRDVTLRDNGEILGMYRKIYADLTELALTEPESIALMNKVATDLGEG
ncbi:helix-turn-helix domain-containing protein [Actinocatenispora rupis]|uniref:Transcriptional regulator n=1 Tax=Actinocatenispora rupis TaxID=519421 RepID=A0A8J3J8M7_9ACTN|nr:helix-turn-helix transcriptional regulator [Actinocatenispora rupis]GID10368.1 transcriptional regulator [Actinocatenispora rupis]